MPIIDIDAHYHEPFDWLDVHFPKLAARVPKLDLAAALGDAISGEFIAQIPKEVRPNPNDLIPEVFKPFFDRLPKGPSSGIELQACLDGMNGEEGGLLLKAFRAPGGWKPEERLALLDAQGIDVQIVNPTIGVGAAERALDILHDKALSVECMAAYNTWATDTVYGHTDRLMPTALLVLDDLDWALAEMKRMRERGSRTFHLPAQPVGGRSLAHPDFDPVWALAEDLGMALEFHVAFAGKTVLADGWGNAGDYLTSMMTYRCHHFQIPTLALTALIFAGVFERHPKLVAMSQELEVGWVPYWLSQMDSICEKNVFSRTSPWKYPLKPSEYAQRNIFASGLPTNLMSIRPAIDNSPTGIIAFASDYPHVEGGPIADARKAYEDQMNACDAKAKGEFFGAAVARAMAL